MKNYSDYYWNEGRPVGVKSFTPQPSDASYKIISDPYHKWISVEKYYGETFDSTVYDSLIFDFRKLKPMHQTAWLKIPLANDSGRAGIRNQDDRLILIEDYAFEGERCRKCSAQSVHGVPVSTQWIYYKALGDPIDGVALFDATGKIVMYKLYNVDTETGEFSEVVEENWCMNSKGQQRWRQLTSPQAAK